MKKSGANYFMITLILLFIIMNPLAVHSYNSILYEEAEHLSIDQAFYFEDGTMFISLQKQVNETCNEPQFNFRIVHPNGTVDAVKIVPPIPEHNFCNGPIFGITPSFPKSLYIHYINSTDVNSASYFVILATQMGDIISNTYVAPASIINGSIYAGGRLYPYNRGEYGFLFAQYETETIVMWSYFEKLDDDNGKLNLLNSGKFYLNGPFDAYYFFPAIDGCYYLINSDTSNYFSNDLSSTELYLTFINPKKNKISDSFLIYSSLIPNLSSTFDIIIACNSNYYMRISNYCIIKFTKISNKRTGFLEISFKDSGAITNYKEFDFRTNGDEIDEYGFAALQFGGYFKFSLKNEKNGYLIFNGTILDDNGNYNSTLVDFPSYLNASKFFLPLIDAETGTFSLIAQDEISWRIFFVNLPKFFTDGGYKNPIIESTYPLINSSISLSTKNINITYRFPVKASANNISIYQYNENSSILRQYVSGKSFLHSSSDHKTISIEILESTFNRPNSKYYIVVDDNAVAELESGQALFGITKKYWNFNTTGIKYKFADKVTGKFSLTSEGSKYFNNFPSQRINEFLSSLKSHLSEVIPVDINRLNDIEYRYNGTQVLLLLHIEPITNPNEPNVESIMRDLDLLIQQKTISPISLYHNTTDLIDENFGFKMHEDLELLAKEYKSYLIGGCCGILFLGIVYLYARLRYSMGKNGVILKLPFTILDAILGIIFTLSDGQKVPYLFIPSVIFLILPVIFDLGASVFIMTQEVKKNELFYVWFKNNVGIGVAFTMLSSIDIKILNTLSSQVAGIMAFNAPMSEDAQWYLFWGDFFKLFIKGIPKFVIQVYFKQSSISYGIIPLLTFIFSAISLLGDIVMRIYHLHKKYKKSKNEPKNEPRHRIPRNNII